jgi:hypothetical protein
MWMVAAGQQPAEAERVGGDDPFQPVPAEPDRPLDMGEGDFDDGRVEHHHQLRACDNQQRQAPTVLATARGRGAARGPPAGGRLRL